VSNLFATIIGVGLGIPVALWINRRIESHTEIERKRRILELLNSELKYNYDDLRHWRYPGGDESSGPTTGDLETGLLSIHVRDEAWNSFSDGGELEWIRDPSLLFQLSTTYFYVRSVKYLAEKFFDLVMMEGRGTPSAYHNNIHKELSSMVELTLTTIDKTFEEIRK
jgi:hypothetical protein